LTTAHRQKEPVAELHEPFSSAGAVPTGWAEAQRTLEQAEVYWISTVRPDGRPHVTPMVGAWLDGALYFTTGPAERKAQNLGQNAHCVITTGCNRISEGLDVILEGDAVLVRDQSTLERVVGQYGAKYQAPFRFTVRDFAFYGEGGEAFVYEVTPTRAFGYGRGKDFTATRFRFERP
jgi:Pyridoxamine 5'-phosphate oxidase